MWPMWMKKLKAATFFEPELILYVFASVAELADAPGLGPGVQLDVEVRVLSLAVVFGITSAIWPDNKGRRFRELRGCNHRLDRHREVLTLTLSRRWRINLGNKSMLDKSSILLYNVINKELTTSSSGRSSVVEHQLPKLAAPVRFWSPASAVSARNS